MTLASDSSVWHTNGTLIIQKKCLTFEDKWVEGLRTEFCVYLINLKMFQRKTNRQIKIVFKYIDREI